MQGEKEAKKRRKKKSKFGYYLYAVIVLLLTIVNISLALLLLTHVQQVEVSGTSLSNKEEITEWLTEDPLTNNAIYTWWKYNYGSYELPVYLENVKVSLGAPWKVKVSVEEKEIIAGFLYKESYVYFDNEGLVMQITADAQTGIPLLEGLEVKSVNLFEKLSVENEKVFSYMGKAAKEIKKNNLFPDRYVWEDDSMNLYFEKVCVKLGKNNFKVKVEQLPAILQDLQGKDGILQMEHYSEIGEKISFKINEPVQENVPEGEDVISEGESTTQEEENVVSESEELEDDDSNESESMTE